MSSTFKTSLLGGFLLLVAGTAMAAPVRYEWTADNYLLSANRDALDAITGDQELYWGEEAKLWAALGGAYGSFVYDDETPQSGATGFGHSLYFGSITEWSSVMYGAGGTIIGSITADVGQTVVGNNNSSSGQDLINVQACINGCGIGYSGFSVGPWLSTFGSAIWTNSEFQTNQDLPDVLPPIGAGTSIASFGFFASPDINAQIYAGNLQIVSATPVPEPSALATLALGLIGFAGLRRRRITARRA